MCYTEYISTKQTDKQIIVSQVKFFVLFQSFIRRTMVLTTADYSWNVFRYVGDYLHLASVLVVIVTLLRNQHCRGFSFKTQLFYFLVFLTRYLDMFTMHFSSNHAIYLFAFKIFYIISSASIVFTMRRWASTIETNKDTCSYLLILAPCLIATVVSVVTNHHPTWTHILWVFSEFLEALAMLPQYIFAYRQDKENKRSDKGIFLFICLVGSYRCLYAANWIYKKIMLGSAYSDSVSWIGGMIEIILFVDFLLNREFLKLIVLSVDARVNLITHQIELKVLRQSSDDDVNVRKRGNPIRPQSDDDEAMLVI
jgi:ER lumen protein retaining receptor